MYILYYYTVLLYYIHDDTDSYTDVSGRRSGEGAEVREIILD